MDSYEEGIERAKDALKKLEVRTPIEARAKAQLMAGWSDEWVRIVAAVSIDAFCEGAMFIRFPVPPMGVCPGECVLMSDGDFPSESSCVRAEMVNGTQTAGPGCLGGKTMHLVPGKGE